VPSANTILINRADKLGIAQLHQLRGRVGRSHHRAYAYLIVPPEHRKCGQTCNGIFLPNTNQNQAQASKALMQRRKSRTETSAQSA